MYITTALFAALALCPLVVHSQVTPQQTIVPFATLPACAQKCYQLYDAQGACSPPNQPASATTDCFCKYSTIQGFYTSATSVCPNACPSDPNGLTGIQSWFLGLCTTGASQSTATTAASSTPTTTSTDTSTPVPVNGGDGNSGSGGTPTNQPWISNHWQWIVMIVVLTLAIIFGWLAACLLRRRYIRRKEREYELRPPAAPWVAGTNHPGGPVAAPYGDGVVPKGKARDSAIFASRPGSLARGPTTGMTSVVSEKPVEKKKWVVKERT